MYARPVLVFPALAALAFATSLPAQSRLVRLGRALFQVKICATCHQVAGGPPALAGLALKAPKFEGDFWGKEVDVTLGYGGKDAKVKFDDAYFIESVRDPSAKVLKSAAAPMPPPPRVNDTEMKALLAYVKSLSGTKSEEGIVAKGALKNFKYAVYHGSWSKLPDFALLEPVKTGTAKSGIADTNLSKQRDNFGIVVEGQLEIKKAGKYTFNVGSDDGSRLIVGGKSVVENDGVHAPKHVTGSTELEPGLVDVRIEYFEKAGGENLSVDMSGPGIKKLQLAHNTAGKPGSKPALITGIPIVPKDGEATIYRNFIKGASPRGIAVGYAEGVSICFDANAMNLVMCWHGAFMDGARHWRGRGQGFQPPSGHYVIHMPRMQAIAELPDADAPWPEIDPNFEHDGRATGLRFRGYKLVQGRRPVFRYTAGETTIEDYVIPKAGKLPSFTRELRLSGTGKYYYLAAADKHIEQRGKRWKVGNLLLLTLEVPGEPILREHAGKKQLLVPIDLDGEAVLRVTCEWDLD